MTFTTIESARQRPIALIGLNRPDKLNAIMIDEINAGFVISGKSMLSSQLRSSTILF